MKEICSQSLSEKRWLLRASDETQVLTYMQKLNLSPTLARFLVMRNVELQAAPLFLEPSIKSHLPDPLILRDMDKAVERLVRAIQNREKILVWGDYDVDGATSSALLHRFFKSLGHSLAIYIPDRIREGYGPNIRGIEKFKTQGYTVMITVDCGTTSFDPLEAALGMDVIILDHHGAESKLPRAHAIVNPNRLDEAAEVTQTLGHLAAVGISFLFVVALNRALREAGFYQNIKPLSKSSMPSQNCHAELVSASKEIPKQVRDDSREGGDTQFRKSSIQEPNLLDLLDLVALGTVCDVMPLTGLNRTFVTQGLKVMSSQKNIGLRALADQAGIDEAPTPYHLGFIMGPRVNAGGRVGESFLGARLLSTEDPEEARKIAQQLHHYNEERRILETDALEQALIQVDPTSPALLVDHDNWHEGVIGIVAGRLKEKYHKPTAVIAWNQDGIGKASARSIPGFDFGGLIRKAHHLGYVLGGGGHAMAAGFSLTKEQLPLLKTFLDEELTRVNQEIDLKPSLLCDGYLDLRSLTLEFMEGLQSLAPFGMGNPNPKFIFTDVVVQSYQIIKDQHIKCRFSGGDGVVVEGMGFRLSDSSLGKALTDGSHRPFDLMAAPKVDTWGGKTKITLMIEDVAYASTAMRQTG